MLSAFKAQPILELKPRDKAKIESLLAYGDRLLVGLSSGALRIYRVNESSNVAEEESDGDTAVSASKSKAVDLMREKDKFSKKPVQQLARVKESNLLVSLSDGYVSLHDLQTYQLVERLERTKGAAYLAVTSNIVKDPETEVQGLVTRLAVATKRKVLCWTWQDLEMLPEVAEIHLEASIKSLNWVDGTRLTAGMDPGFCIVDITSQEITPINRSAPKTASSADVNAGELTGVRFGAVSSSGMGYMGMSSWVPKPMAASLSNSEILLAKDVNTLFVNIEGKATEKRQVPWALAPEAIGYSYPYLLALNPPEKGTLQIRNPDTLSLLQTISVPGASLLHVPQPNISLAHAGKGFLVASDRVIWRMNVLPYDKQIAELVEKQRFDEGISFLSLLEDTLIDDKDGRIREIKTQKAISLFHQQNYRPALDLFTQAETSPERVIALYPSSVAGDLSSIPETTSEEEPAPAEEETKDVASPSKGMLGKLRGSKKADPETASIKGPARGDTDNMSIRTRAPAKAADKSLEGEDLKFAVRCLCSFLAETRKQMPKYLNFDGTLREKPPQFDSETGRPAFANLLPQEIIDKRAEGVDWEAELLKTAQLVDTTLFRSYMLAVPSLAGSLFRLDNFCDPDVVQKFLYQSERYSDLIDFLHGKKLHRQALEMLVKLGKKEADGEVSESMRGPERTVSYLKQLPPELVDLVLEFVQWPIEAEPQTAMEVFLADSDNAEKLPRQRIVDFLAETDPKLEMQYLEHIVYELGEDDADLHQQLIDLYLTELKQNDISGEERSGLKDKLESFLTKSKGFNKIKTFKQLPADNPLFYESRAIVLSAMGNHKQALSIYVFQIKDFDKAEAYCSKTFLEEQAKEQTAEEDIRSIEPEDTIAKPNIFAILLGLYLQPPSGEEKRWPQALDLLSKHGARLPASSTLDLMPDDLAVKELQDYFRGRIRNATSMLRQEMIVRSLEGVRRANTERTLLIGPDNLPDDKPAGRNRMVRIGEDDHCKVCQKLFRNSAVRVYPNNEVIHYGCVDRRAREGATGSMKRPTSGWA